MEQVSEDVMRKLAKIKALAGNAGTEGEAMAAARMLNEMLMRHKLELSDIDYDLSVKDEPIERHIMSSKWMGYKQYYKDYPDVEIKKKRCEYSENLASLIAETYGCAILIHTGSSRITFVGRKSNVAVVEYMYITMLRVVEKLSWKEYKTARNKVKWEQIKNYPKEIQNTVPVDYSELEGYRNSWIDGFVRRVGEMLLEEHHKNETTSTTALMRVSQDGVATRAFIDSLNPKKAKSLNSGYRGFNDRGYNDGKARASEVGLTARGMGTSGQPAKQLG